MPAKLELAILSNLSYENNDKVKNNCPAGWELYIPANLNLLGNGLHITIFINSTAREIVFAFRGTDFSKLSGYIDIAKIIIQDAPQTYTGNARKFVKDNLTALRKNYEDWQVYMTGHSKGGLYATFAGLAHQCPVVAFNSPGAGEFLNELGITNSNETLILNIITEPHIVTQCGRVLGSVDPIGLPPNVRKRIKWYKTLTFNPITQAMRDTLILKEQHKLTHVIAQLELLQNPNYNPKPEEANIFQQAVGFALNNGIPTKFPEFLNMLGLSTNDIPIELRPIIYELFKDTFNIELPDLNMNPIEFTLSNFDMFGDAISFFGEIFHSNPLKKISQYTEETIKSWGKNVAKQIPQALSSFLGSLSMVSPAGWVIGATVAIFGMTRWADRRNERRYQDLKNDMRALGTKMDDVYANLSLKLDNIIHLQIMLFEYMQQGFKRLETILVDQINDFKETTLTYLRHIEADMWTMFQVTENRELAVFFSQFEQILNQIDAYVEKRIPINSQTHQALIRDMISLMGWLTQDASRPEFNGSAYYTVNAVNTVHWGSKVLKVFYANNRIDFNNLIGYFARCSIDLFNEIDNSKNNNRNKNPIRKLSVNFQLDWIFHPVLWVEGVQQYLRARPLTQGYDTGYKDAETLIKHGMNFREWIKSLYSPDLFNLLFNKYENALTKAQAQLTKITQETIIGYTNNEDYPIIFDVGSYPQYDQANSNELNNYIAEYKNSIAQIQETNENRLKEEAQYVYQFITGSITKEQFGQNVTLPINTIARITENNYSRQFIPNYRIPLGEITSMILKKIKISPIVLIAERLGIGTIMISYEFTSHISPYSTLNNGNKLIFTVSYIDQIGSSYILARTQAIDFVINNNNEFSIGKFAHHMYVEVCCKYYNGNKPVYNALVGPCLAFNMVVISKGQNINFDLQLEDERLNNQLYLNLEEAIAQKIAKLQSSISEYIPFIFEPNDKNAVAMRKVFEQVDLYYYLLLGYMILIGCNPTDNKDECDLRLMSSVPTRSNFPPGNHSTYVLVQSSSGATPTGLYFVNRREKDPVITRLTFLPNQSISTFTNALFPKDNVCTDLLSLSTQQLQIITSITGHTHKNTYDLQKDMWNLEKFIAYYIEGRNLNFLPQAKEAMQKLQRDIIGKLNGNRIFINYLFHEINCCIAALCYMRHQPIPEDLLIDIQAFTNNGLIMPSNQSGLPSSTMNSDPTTTLPTVCATSFAEEIKRLIKDKQFSFTLKRASGNELQINFTAANTVIMEINKIRDALVRLINFFEENLEQQNLKVQCKLVANWNNYSLTISANNFTTIDNVVKILKLAGTDCWMNEASVSQNLFFKPPSEGTKQGALKSTERQNVTECSVQ